METCDTVFKQKVLTRTFKFLFETAYTAVKIYSKSWQRTKVFRAKVPNVPSTDISTAQRNLTKSHRSWSQSYRCLCLISLHNQTDFKLQACCLTGDYGERLRRFQRLHGISCCNLTKLNEISPELERSHRRLCLTGAHKQTDFKLQGKKRQSLLLNNVLYETLVNTLRRQCSSRKTSTPLPRNFSRGNKSASRSKCL